MINNKKLQAMAEELAKDLKTPDDLSQLSATLTKLTVEAALKGEMNNPLGTINTTLQVIIAATAAMVIPLKNSRVITVKSKYKHLGIVTPPLSLS